MSKSTLYMFLVGGPSARPEQRTHPTMPLSSPVNALLAPWERRHGFLPLEYEAQRRLDAQKRKSPEPRPGGNER